MALVVALVIHVFEYVLPRFWWSSSKGLVAVSVFYRILVLHEFLRASIDLQMIWFLDWLCSLLSTMSVIFCEHGLFGGSRPNPTSFGPLFFLLASCQLWDNLISSTCHIFEWFFRTKQEKDVNFQTQLVSSILMKFWVSYGCFSETGPFRTSTEVSFKKLKK